MIDVYVYLFDQLETLGDSFVEKNICKMPESRREYCLRYRRIADRQTCVVSYLLLLRGLNEKYGITGPVEFERNAQSKPYLKDYPRIYFNISHCGSGAVCAVSDFEIGIDIEEIHPFDPGVARLVCTAGELRRLDESAEKERLFCRIWTGKECYAKAWGISVADILGSEPPAGEILRREWDKYMVALCCANRAAAQIRAEWTVGDGTVLSTF